MDLQSFLGSFPFVPPLLPVRYAPRSYRARTIYAPTKLEGGEHKRKRSVSFLNITVKISAFRHKLSEAKGLVIDLG